MICFLDLDNSCLGETNKFIYLHTPFVHGGGDDAGAVDANLLPGRLRHVEVHPRRVAPAAAVAGQRVVGRAEVGGSDGDRDAGPAEHRIRSLAVAGDAPCSAPPSACRTPANTDCRTCRNMGQKNKKFVPHKTGLLQL